VKRLERVRLERPRRPPQMNKCSAAVMAYTGVTTFQRRMVRDRPFSTNQLPVAKMLRH
jgi:hypothetical protein